jgi:hypothetical protein
MKKQKFYCERCVESYGGELKPVSFSNHALGYCERRGFTIAEVEEAIRTEEWHPADFERLECRKEFSFNAEWNGNFFATKQVRPIFVEESDEIVVITVYTFFY